MSKETTLLAIETSCDETGVAVMRTDRSSGSFLSKGGAVRVLAGAVASQMDVHEETGGVVPEAAAREHVRVLRPMIEKVMGEAGVGHANLDGVAVTYGPGLIPALAVGVQAARTLAYAWDLPIVPVHHIEGHMYSALLSGAESGSKNQEQESGNSSNSQRTTYNIPTDIFPALLLIVSGGHTQLIRMDEHLRYQVIGTTRDDAAGEAFDKVARLLQLPYPGGPHLSKLAEQGDPQREPFSVPMRDSNDLDFSFSGLKTSVLYRVRELQDAHGFDDQRRADIAAGFQEAVIASLIGKTREALETPPNLPLSRGGTDGYRTLGLAGGVAANQLLRERMTQLAEAHHVPLRTAPLALCGDNAEMIGQVGLLAYEAGRTSSWSAVDAQARAALADQWI